MLRLKQETSQKAEHEKEHETWQKLVINVKPENGGFCKC